MICLKFECDQDSIHVKNETLPKFYACFNQVICKFNQDFINNPRVLLPSKGRKYALSAPKGK